MKQWPEEVEARVRQVERIKFDVSDEVKGSGSEVDEDSPK